MGAATGIARGVRALEKAFQLKKFRPKFRSAVVAEAALDKVIRGPDAATVMSNALVDVAGAPAVGGMTSTQYAMYVLNQVEIPTDLRVGGALKDAGLDAGKMTPLQRGKRLLDHQVPELNEGAKKFLPQQSAITREEHIARNLAALKEEVPPAGPPFERIPADPKKRKVPETRPGNLLPLEGASSFREGGDSNWFITGLAGPQFVLDDARDPIARGIFLTQRRARLNANVTAARFEEKLAAAGKILSRVKKKDRQELSKRFFRVVNSIDTAGLKTALKEMPNRESAEAALEVRDFLTRWLDDHRGLANEFFNAANVDDAVRTAARNDYNKRGILDRLGLLVFRESDFFYDSINGARRPGSIPAELAGVDLGNNAALAHIFGGKPKEDIIEVMRALTTGMIRKEVLEPAYREMGIAAQNLPGNKRIYVEDWLKNLKGVPAVFDRILDNSYRLGRTRLNFNFARGPVSELSGFLLAGWYRGALYGNGGYYLANFIGQAFLNPAAKYGPFRAFQGIARHFEESFDRLPSQALMGGFEALFGRDIPKTAFGKELNRMRGVRDTRRFLRWMDENSGPARSEFINRSIGVHVGLAEAIDRYNMRNGANITWDMLMRGQVDDQIANNLMFEALLDSERVNFLYGMDGTNPILGRIFGRAIIGHVAQFLSFFPKQAEFLLGPLIKEGDPGVFLKYLFLAGFLSRNAGMAWGIDLESAYFFGSVPRTREGVPLPVGPSIQALWLMLKSINSDDELERARLTKELMRTVGLLYHPGVTQREKTVRFFQALRTERLLDPNGPPWELQQVWGPTAAEQQGPIFGPAGGFKPTPENLERNIQNILHSETPARALGFPVLSDRQERRILREIKRANTVWSAQARDLTKQMLTEMQLHGTNTEKFRGLMDRARDDGWPIDGMLQDGVLRAVLPRIMRVFLEQPIMIKAQFYDLLEQLYDETFTDTPEVPLELREQPERFGRFGQSVERVPRATLGLPPGVSPGDAAILKALEEE